MARALSVGEQAPNFDLTSTEDVLLMLCDEVVRTAVVVYFFAGIDGDRVRDDLLAFARHWDELATADTRVLGVSPAGITQLKEIQRELHLPFPLLNDDRGFSAAYGLETAEDDVQPQPVVAVVNRRQEILLIERVDSSVEALMEEVLKRVKSLPSPAASLPRKVVNRLVDRWVN